MNNFSLFKNDRFLSASHLVAVLGIGFGIAALLISLSIISGFQKAYKEAILKFNAHLVITQVDEIKNPAAVLSQLPADFQKEVIGWHPFIYREGMLINRQDLKGIVIKGVDLERLQSLSGMTLHFDSKDQKGLLLGKTLADEVGSVSAVRLLFPQRGSIGPARRFPVSGYFVSGLHEYDASFAFLPLAEAQRFFKMENRVSGIEIWLQDPDQAIGWAEQFRKTLPFPFVVWSWKDLNENLFRALELEKAVFFILMFFLSGIASLNLVASLVMLLLKKRREIAILRVLGLSWSRLTKLFLFDGVLIGSLGLGIGVILATGILIWIQYWQPLSLAPEVYFIRYVPVDYSVRNLLWVTGGGMFLILLGTGLTLSRMKQIPVLHSLIEG